MTGSCRRSCVREDGGLRYRVRPRHKLRAELPGRRAGVAQQESGRRCLQAAGCWRDRFLLVLLWFSGLRIGEALGLRRSDLHLMASATELGCRAAGAHLHVVPRENVNGARGEGPARAGGPAGALRRCPTTTSTWMSASAAVPAAECDFVFVNLFAEPLGAPMRYGRVAQLFRSLSRASGAWRGAVTPHMLRHAAGSALTAAGGLDVAQAMLGHASITSTQIYVHAERRASARRGRAAVAQRCAISDGGGAVGERARRSRRASRPSTMITRVGCRAG